MSTVMHCYRIKRKDWWNFVTQVREFYLKENILAYILGNIDKDAVRGDQYFMSLLHVLEDDSNSVDIQVFEDVNEGQYLFRVLEHGYTFMNSFEDRNWPIIPIHYDDRTDVPDEDKHNKAIAEWVNMMIDKRQYFIYPILGDTDWLRIFWCHGRDKDTEINESP